MKILETPITTWNEKIECRYCKAKLEIDENDVAYKKEKQYDCRNEQYDAKVFYVICPCCNREHNLDDNKLPHFLKYKLRGNKEW